MSQKLRIVQKKNSGIQKCDSEHCASFEMSKQIFSLGSVKTLENFEKKNH